MTNKSAARPKNAGMLHSYLAFLGFIFSLRTLWPSSRAKFNTCGVRSPVCLHKDPSAFHQRACSLTPPGQFLLEESRLLEAAEMAEKAARLDGGEFDVVFSAAHMLR